MARAVESEVLRVFFAGAVADLARPASRNSQSLP